MKGKKQAFGALNVSQSTDILKDAALTFQPEKISQQNVQQMPTLQVQIDSIQKASRKFGQKLQESQLDSFPLRKTHQDILETSKSSRILSSQYGDQHRSFLWALQPRQLLSLGRSKSEKRITLLRTLCTLAAEELFSKSNASKVSTKHLKLLSSNRSKIVQELQTIDDDMEKITVLGKNLGIAVSKQTNNHDIAEILLLLANQQRRSMVVFRELCGVVQNIRFQTQNCAQVSNQELVEVRKQQQALMLFVQTLSQDVAVLRLLANKDKELAKTTQKIVCLAKKPRVPTE